MAFQGVALGCGNFGGIGSAPEFFGQGIDEETALQIMDEAWAGGIRWFDTGDAYGGGQSEAFIGRWLRERQPAGLQLTTKVFHSTTGTPGDVGLAPDRIRRQLDGSLQRLGVDRVDLYLAHEPDDSVPLEQTIETFEALRSEGLIGAWGLSNYDADGVREALAVATPALLQNSYSLLDRGDEDAVIPLCAEHGIAYVPFGPLAGGWLTGKYRRGEAFPSGSRMTQRPGPYAEYVVGRGVRRPGAAGSRGRGARRRDVGARVRVGALEPRRRGRRLRPDAARAPAAGADRRRTDDPRRRT